MVPFFNKWVGRQRPLEHVRQKGSYRISTHHGVPHHDTLYSWNDIRRKLFRNGPILDDIHEKRRLIREFLSIDRRISVILTAFEILSLLRRTGIFAENNLTRVKVLKDKKHPRGCVMSFIILQDSSTNRILNDRIKLHRKFRCENAHRNRMERPNGFASGEWESDIQAKEHEFLLSLRQVRIDERVKRSRIIERLSVPLG